MGSAEVCGGAPFWRVDFDLASDLERDKDLDRSGPGREGGGGARSEGSINGF